MTFFVAPIMSTTGFISAIASFILSHPLYETFVNRRRKDLLRLKMGTISTEQFKEKWDWASMTIFEYRGINDNALMAEIESSGDARQELDKIGEEANQYENAYKKIYARLSPGLKKQVDLMQKLIYVRDYRYEQVQRCLYNSVMLLRAIAAKMRLSYEELIWLTPQEIMAKQIPKDLKARMKDVAYYKLRIYTGKKAKEVFDALNPTQEVDSVLGRGVSSGVARGPAKIAINRDQLGKIERGDILICATTSPDYMLALHRVAGIVATMGGFTSHAAVVAREFGIPCIVGANNATNIFKDGDVVELDADKGVVRKLK